MDKQRDWDKRYRSEVMTMLHKIDGEQSMQKTRWRKTQAGWNNFCSVVQTANSPPSAIVLSHGRRGTHEGARNMQPSWP